MGTEKKKVTDFLGASRVPASSLVPPTPGYQTSKSLLVEIDGRTYDILSFNVEAARSLLAKAGFDQTTGTGRHAVETTYHYPVLPDSQLKGEIFQEQWRRNLGIRVSLAAHEFSVHWEMIRNGNYDGVADYAFFAPYFDPNPFLEQFSTGGPGNPAGWTDPVYAGMLADANRTINPQTRMTRLADCEQRLMRAMPFVPLYVDAWAYLQKPFVRALRGNRLADMRSFKYAWIDTNWRAS
jgi:ABC-type transport system substrate-binding protein